MQEMMLDISGDRSELFSSPSCMAHPDMYTNHQPGWSNAPPASSRWERFCSSTQSTVQSPSSSACNASRYLCPALKDSTQRWNIKGKSLLLMTLMKNHVCFKRNTTKKTFSLSFPACGTLYQWIKSTLWIYTVFSWNKSELTAISLVRETKS